MPTPGAALVLCASPRPPLLSSTSGELVQHLPGPGVSQGTRFPPGPLPTVWPPGGGSVPFLAGVPSSVYGQYIIPSDTFIQNVEDP